MTDSKVVPPSATGPWGDVERFARALSAAARLHDGQYRKGTSIPYITHLLGTCSIALEYGADQDQAIAALLHDVLEDVEPSIAAPAVAVFGDEVLRIVEACTDARAGDKPPWRERKVAYLKRLLDDDGRVLLVSASDKLHNARAILRDLRDEGEAIWTRFNAGRNGQVWYYRALVAAFRSNPEHPRPLVDELDRTVTEIEQLAGRLS
jgi:GTP pyrophosphokinase